MPAQSPTVGTAKNRRVGGVHADIEEVAHIKTSGPVGEHKAGLWMGAG